jgi:transketolase C-terminal domain/subunit
MREEFVATTTALLDEDPRTALVLADISADAFAPAQRRHPDRVLNVGIREQLMTGVAGGLALTGLRPYVHSYATFAVDRSYEQIKLDLGHQGVGAVLVSIGASYDASTAGYTHPTSPCWTRSAIGPSTCRATPARFRPCCARPPRPTTSCTCGSPPSTTRQPGR